MTTRSNDDVVRFFCIRKKDEPDLCWTPQGEWTNNFLGAAMLTSRQKAAYTLPEGGEFWEIQPGDIEDGGFSYETVLIPIWEGDRLMPFFPDPSKTIALMSTLRQLLEAEPHHSASATWRATRDLAARELHEHLSVRLRRDY